MRGQPRTGSAPDPRQAIEKRFILDVLLGYTTHRRLFKLAKAITEEPYLDSEVLLALHNDIHDADLGSYTVKVYPSDKEATEGAGWLHSRVTLTPIPRSRRTGRWRSRTWKKVSCASAQSLLRCWGEGSATPSPPER